MNSDCRALRHSDLDFVTFGLVGIDVFSVNVPTIVLILIVGLDTFAFWVHDP